jgi:hypothetical protein
MKSLKGERTPEEREEARRQVRITQRARQIQRRMDRDMLLAKMPDVVEALFIDGDDDSFDSEFMVEYTETWTNTRFPHASIAIKTERSFFSEEQLVPLFAISRQLGMSGSLHAGLVTEEGDSRRLEFHLRPRSSKLYEPSEEAFAAARVEIEATEKDAKSA